MATSKTPKNPELTKSISKSKSQKNGPAFKISLSEEQKEAKRIALENVVTVLLGKAGSGKTQLAVNIACDLFYKGGGNIEKIVIARPLVPAGEETGFLPGDIKEKTDPYMQPIYANMYQLLGKQNTEKLIIEGVIEIIPFAFMRGITYTNSIVIIDEAQNCTDAQIEMALGRIGFGSKMLICGDVAQIDLKDKRNSGLNFLKKVEERVKGFKVVTLLKNHRHPIVEEILEVYKDKNN